MDNSVSTGNDKSKDDIVVDAMPVSDDHWTEILKSIQRNPNVGQVKRNVITTKQNHCWGQLFTPCRTCINLYQREVIISRRIILKVGFERHKKLAARISRNHFVLKLKHMVNGLHTVRITDLSTCGTFVNGRRIGKNETITLFDEDVISIVHPSHSLFKFRDLSNKRCT